MVEFVLCWLNNYQRWLHSSFRDAARFFSLTGWALELLIFSLLLALACVLLACRSRVCCVITRFLADANEQQQHIINGNNWAKRVIVMKRIGRPTTSEVVRSSFARRTHQRAAESREKRKKWKIDYGRSVRGGRYKKPPWTRHWPPKFIIELLH